MASKRYVLSFHSLRYCFATSRILLLANNHPSQKTACKPSDSSPTLFVKAAADGVSVGDCPFAHAVRMGLFAKRGLRYDVRPCNQSAKPTWLVEHYDGKMPALKHDGDCYVDSDRILSYLDFFFDPKDSLFPPTIDEGAVESTGSFFGALAGYIKNTDDANDADLFNGLRAELEKMEKTASSNDFDWFASESISYLDCELAPKFHVMR